MKKNEIGFVYLKIQFQKSRIVKVLSWNFQILKFSNWVVERSALEENHTNLKLILSHSVVEEKNRFQGRIESFKKSTLKQFKFLKLC